MGKGVRVVDYFVGGCCKKERMEDRRVHVGGRNSK
jgi:hypothetical protein